MGISDDDKKTISQAMKLLSLRRTPEKRKGKEAKEWVCPICNVKQKSTRLFRLHLRELHDVHWRLVLEGGKLLPAATVTKNLEAYRKRKEQREGGGKTVKK